MALPTAADYVGKIPCLVGLRQDIFETGSFEIKGVLPIIANECKLNLQPKLKFKP